MKFVRSGRVWVECLALLVWGGLALVVSPAETLSADAVVQKTLARAQQKEAKAAQPGYTYTKVTVTEELDGAGDVKERKEKLYQVLCEGGLTHLKLLEVNGKPLDASEAKKQLELELKFRQSIGQSDARKGDNRENFLTPDMISRFQFTLVGQVPINGRTACQLTFLPKLPAPPAHNLSERVMNRISGTVWIDVEEFEIVHADIQLLSEVDLLWGLVGSLKKMVFSLSRTRVADGVWFNAASNGDFEARKLLDSTHTKTRSESTNFRPLAAR